MYLKSKLGNLATSETVTDFELALIARGLQLTRSSGAETAFEILAKRRRENAAQKTVYWGKGDGDVAASALALLVYLDRNERLVEPAVEWLNLNRLSRRDSPLARVLAYSAISLWEDKHGGLGEQPESLTFNVKRSGRTQVARVTPGFPQRLTLHNVTAGESVWIEGKGRGRGLVLFKTEYEPDEGSSEEQGQNGPLFLDLTVRNSSRKVTIRACQRYLSTLGLTICSRYLFPYF